MSRPTFDDSLWLLSRARGPALVARTAIVVSPIVATICTAIAAGRPFVLGAAVIVVLSAWCAVLPDSAAGLFVIATLALEWIIRVDDHTSAWSIAIAVSIGVFHMALACASAAPGGAPMARSVYAPWIRNTAVAIVPSVAVWVAIVTLDRLDPGSASLLVAVALIAVAVAGSWSVSRSIHRRSAPTRSKQVSL